MSLSRPATVIGSWPAAAAAHSLFEAHQAWSPHGHRGLSRMIPRKRRMLTVLRTGKHGPGSDTSLGASSRGFMTPSRGRNPIGEAGAVPVKVPVWVFREDGVKTFAQLSRQQLMSELSVSARLVRMIDGSIMNRHPVVAAHGSSVIVSLDGDTRLVVKRDRVVMMDPCTPTGVRLHAALSKALAKRKCPSSLALRNESARPTSPPASPSAAAELGGNDDDLDWCPIHEDHLEEEVPFVIRAIDGVLKFSTAEMDNQLYTLANAVGSILILLAQDASDESLQKLIPIKSSLAAFRVHVKEFKEAVDDVATDEKQLRRFDLESSITSNHDHNVYAAQDLNSPSSSANSKTSRSERTRESLVNVQAHLDLVEEIFDHYYYIADEIDNEVNQLIKDIRGHEEVLAIQLDTQRNQLINLNLFVSTGAFVAGCSSMLAGLFGMNTHVEDSLGAAGLSQALAFPIVAGSIFGLAGATSFGLYRVYRSKVHGRDTAVQAQVVMEKLFWHADRIEATLLKTHGAHVSLDRNHFSRVLTDAIGPTGLTKGEITSVFNLFVGSDQMVQADFILSVLHQRKQATRAHPRLKLMAPGFTGTN